MRRITERQQLIDLAREIGVRADWHEPDEQSISASVEGVSFDNAGFWPEMGNRLSDEMHVRLWRTEVVNGHEVKVGEPIAAVNLATLFSWACDQASKGEAVMTDEIKRGTRVRVTYEADYWKSHNNEHIISSESQLYALPSDATIEVLSEPLPPEPPIGSVVEVSPSTYVGQPSFHYKRAKDGFWYGLGGVGCRDWASICKREKRDWASICKGRKTVLLVPEKPTAEAIAPPVEPKTDEPPFRSLVSVGAPDGYTSLFLRCVSGWYRVHALSGELRPVSWLYILKLAERAGTPVVLITSKVI